MNVAPSLPRFDATNGVFPNTILRSNFALKPRIGTNSQYLRLGQFRRSASLSAIRGAMFNAIQLIVARGVPTQIFKAVIPRVTVVMTALHSLRARANKSRQHQRVWAHNFLFAIFPQIHKWPRVIDVFGICLNSPSFNGTYAAMIRNLVQPLKSNNGFPVFHKNPLGMTMGMLP